jgi:hypothetical protein
LFRSVTRKLLAVQLNVEVISTRLTAAKTIVVNNA